MRATTWLGLAVSVVACAGGPGPGDFGRAYHVDGQYLGRLMVEGDPFDATFRLDTRADGRVRGTFHVRAPMEIEGDVVGRIVDDVFRVTLVYDAPGRDLPRGCEGRVEGILTVSPGGDEVDGPVTITDCGDALPGRMSFRRVPGP